MPDAVDAFEASPPWSQWPRLDWSDVLPLAASAFALGVVARNWVVTYLIPFGFSLAQAIMYAGTFVLSALVLAREVPRLRVVVVVMLLAFLPGSLLAQYQGESMMRWIGLVATIAAVGPLVFSNSARLVRAVVWKWMAAAWMVTAVASVLWALLPLPSMNYGIFSGISVHPKTLALDANLALCVFVAWMTRGNAKMLVPASLVSVVVIVLSGSRATLISAAACVVAIPVVRRVRISRLIPGALVVAGIAFILAPLAEESGDTKTAQYYRDKGLENTREHLWAMRIQEIEHHPLFGVGIGMAEVMRPTSEMDDSGLGAGVTYVEAGGRVAVEPGSSWLAVFSMTGVTGGLLFLVVVAQALWALTTLYRFVDRRKVAELAGAMLAFILHMVEGGFVLSFGNPHCLVFWLLVAIIFDLRTSATPMALELRES